MSGLEEGSTLGGYEILARLRAGAMGALYLARRLGPAGFARPVAIKVIHDHLAQNERFARMFIAEAKLSARIDDPHVVRVEEFGEADGRYYLVMEYVHGVSLAQALGVLRKRGGLPLDVSVAIAMDIASGLHAAHEATDEDGQLLGIVHRDVSPHNVLVSYKGYVKVIDFGIAKAKESAGQTLTGSIRGKLAYMPPEQARSAKHVDRRADLYALGLVLWEMLAGKRLFDGTSDLALLSQIKDPLIVAPSTVDRRVPKELDAVVLELLKQDPQERPPNAATVARMLASAFPAATKVLAADIAAVMNEVRRAALETKDGEEDEEGSAYGREVKNHLTIFGRSMQESVEAADVTEKKKRPPVQDKTEVMAKHPVARPPRMADESDDDGDDAATQRLTPAEAQRIARPTGMQGRTMPLASSLVLPRAPDAPDAPPKAPAFLPAFLPAWVTPPVMVLAPLTLALAVALIVVQCGARGSSASAIPSPSAMPAPQATTAAPVMAAVTVEPLPVAADPVPPQAAPAKPALVSAPKPKPADSRTPLERAREAALDGKPQEVRSLLETRVRSGHGTHEEARLLRAACRAMGDTACADDVAQKYPPHSRE